MRVIIDNFVQRQYDQNALYLLTHDHTDSADVPKSWKHPILTTPVVANIVNHPAVHGVFQELNRWYLLDNVRVFVFPTEHCCGSVGFFIKETQHMFLGDGRVTNHILNIIKRFKIKHVTLDGYTRMIKNEAGKLRYKDFPTIQSSASKFWLLIQSIHKFYPSRSIMVCVAHTGQLYALFRGDKPPDYITVTIGQCRLSQSQQSQNNIRTVNVSSSYWMFSPRKHDINMPYLTPKGWQLFLSVHASQNENNHVTEMLRSSRISYT